MQNHITQNCLSLMYHNVHRDEDTFSELSPSVCRYFVNESQFRFQMQRIVESTAPTTLAELCLSLESKRKENLKSEINTPTETQVHINFDDGWLGTLEVAGPILEEHNLEGTIFITQDLIGKPHFMTEQHLSKLPSKVFQIGAHGKTHRILNTLNREELLEELTAPKKYLEDLCGVAVETLAYPGGGVSPLVEQMALEAGYKFLFTSHIGVIDLATKPRDIPRVAITKETTSNDFDRYLELNLGKEAWKARLLQLPKRLLGRTLYSRIRAALLGEKSDQQEMTDL